MPSILPGYEYDIFISYRQNDNLPTGKVGQDGWVTEFVESLNKEIKATFKEQINIYFDQNPYDGIGESDDVDDSLAKKLKCIIFIPIISKTYCDTNSFAWTNEFLFFKKLAENDDYGIKVNLPNGNISSRILPIRIHDIDEEDKQLLEKEIGFLRSIDFIFKEPGVNRPLVPNDSEDKNLNSTNYRNQVNKVANSIQEIIKGIKGAANSSNENEQLSAAAEEAKAEPIKRDTKGILIGAIAILLVAAISYLIMTNDSEDSIESEIEKSIAVMPFDDISQDGDQQYFADGVMEDILTQLQKIGEIRVTSRTSVEQYRDSDKAAPVIGEELGVSYLLEGSVRKSANQILVTAQLIRTSDDSHLWADNVTSEYSAEGLFELQYKIAQKIVEQLKLKISPDKLQQNKTKLTDNIVAYDLYRLAKSYYWTDLMLSIATTKQAIRADSNFKEAYGLLANAFAQKGANEYPVLSLFDSSEVYANKGIQLGDCSECYTALAKVAEKKYQNIAQSITYDAKAVQIDPQNGISTSNNVMRALRSGDWETALENTSAVIEIAKSNWAGTGQRAFINYHLCWLYFNMELDKQSSTHIDFFRKDPEFLGSNVNSQLSTVFLSLNDSVWFNNAIDAAFAAERGDRDRSQYNHKKIIGNHWLNKDFQSIIDYYEQGEKEILLVPSDDEIAPMIAHSYWKLGMVDKAAEVLQTSVSQPKNGPTKYFKFEKAMLSQYLGNLDEALEWIGQAIDSGYLFDLEADEMIEPLRNNPRFRELVDKQRKKKEEVQAMAATYNFPKPEDLR